MTSCASCGSHEHPPMSNPSAGSPYASCVPNGWFVVNPRRMAELEAAEEAVMRARDLADEWATEPYAEAFMSMLAGVLIDTLAGDQS